MRVEEGGEQSVVVAGVRQVGRNDIGLRPVRFGLGCGRGEWRAGFGGGTFGVGEGCCAGAHLGAVEQFEGEQRRSG
ncbi:hypothetical protein [Streptomyces antibioticus]|uniref:hypothetical protein n=1 Tax=Streptomyces antibioticus TaxID=1890 RepID=UPI0036FB113A